MSRILLLLAAVLATVVAPARALQFRTVEPLAIDGAFDLIIVPEPWNGNLFLYAHGYTADARSLVPYPADITPANFTTKLKGGDLVLQIPLNFGYAVGTTTYRSVGWAVADAERDLENLRKHFVNTYGKPTFTYVWGHSEGGMVTETVIENEKGAYDGALPFCAPGAGGRRNFNGAWDLRAVYEYVCKDVPDAQFLCHVCSDGQTRCLADADCPGGSTCGGPEPPTPPEDGLSAACADLLLREPAVQSEFVGTRFVACFGGNTPTSEQATRRDLFRRATQLADDFLPIDIYFAAVGLGEITDRRTGGLHAWSNDGVDYASPLLTSTERSLLNAGVPRASNDPAATRYLRRWYEPHGRTTAKVLTLHALDDGLVLPENEEKYSEAFLAAGRTSQLVQLFTPTGGHCGFSGAEHLAAFLALTGWVEHGVVPTAAATQASCTSLEPIAGGPCQIEEFSPAEFGTRVVERAQGGVQPRSLVCEGDVGDCPGTSTCSLPSHHCR